MQVFLLAAAQLYAFSYSFTMMLFLRPPFFHVTRHLPALLLLCFLMLAASCKKPIPAATDRNAIVATVNAFHAALERGDGAAAMELLAPDAQVLEMGTRETREQYSGEHLKADIQFAKTVPSTRSGLIVRQEGEVAWLTQTSLSQGTFMSRTVDSEGTELMVLARTGGQWKIRAIHWSSHTHRAAE